MDSEEIKLMLVENVIWLILLGTILIVGAKLGSRFFSIDTFETIVYSSAMLAMIVFAEAICLLGGNFDLSVGQLAGFAAMANAAFITAYPGIPWYGGVLSIIAIGAAAGALNGLLIGKGGLNPFLMTLGTYLVFKGGTQVVSLHTITGPFPDNYLAIGGAKTGGIPYAVILLVVVLGILYFVLRQTKFGSDIYSVGGNEDSAMRAGINTGNVVFYTFLISGMLSGLAGLMYTGYISSATPGLADNTVFMAFAGAVIGGISLDGGEGSIINALGGVLFLGTIEAALTMLAVPPQQVQVFQGVLVVVAIIINRFRDEIKTKIAVKS